ncbi:MAG: flagellar biosynthesis protein FlhA [Rickettsiales bacterium]
MDRAAWLGRLKASGKHLDILFACGILGIIAVLIFPIPSWLMDMLLSISITFSVIILMTVLFVNRALDFNSFPSILLVVTVLRLALNISSTRLILTDGHNGPSAAGHVIEAFGLFVMQGSVVIGVIVFAILTIINFIVITKGSGRIAEVAARFSLDAMPGKQMAIDADLSAGMIDEDTARRRRKDLESESTFFGAMDGANKFVRGDAIAGVIITFINFVAGIIIGVVQKGMSFDLALQTYTLLTIGEGLVAQIPALIVSTSAGLLVTKSGMKGSAEKAIFSQIANYPQALGVTSGLLFTMALMPSIPAIPFIITGFLTGSLGYYVHQNKEAIQEMMAEEQDPLKGGKLAVGGALSAQDAAKDESMIEFLTIDSIRLELGYELLPLINYSKGHKLTDQIKALRKQIAKDLGFVLPAVRIQDNMQASPREYVIKIKDIECGRGVVDPTRLLIMDPKGGELTIIGDDTKEPAFNLPARWIDEQYKEEALFKEYTVVDPPTVITTHITEIIKENIIDLLSYKETQNLLEGLSDEHKKLAAEIIPSQISVTTLQRILQGLLSESVSIKDLPTILEAISEKATQSTNVVNVIEHVRSRLSKQLCYANLTDNGYIPFVVLSQVWEQTFAESLVSKDADKQLSMPPSKLQQFVNDVNREFEKHAVQGELPVLLTSPTIRPYVRSIVERFRPSIVVMSQNEIHPKIKIRTLGQV